MKGRFLMSFKEDSSEGNIYAVKSALILNWLLLQGLKRDDFSLREVAKEVGLSVGLVQRVFNILVLKGFLQVEGLRTAKRFFFQKSKLLLESWLEHYSIVRKCRMRTYRSALAGRTELLKALKQSGLEQKTALALHSAAEAYGYKNTNLDTLELYVLDPIVREKLENALQLEPQERGYEVLLIEPYYKSLLNQALEHDKGLKICPLLLTFLDLYHFPLRGREQAEFISERAPEIKQIHASKPRK